MKGFQGLSRAQWALIKGLFPKPPSSKFGRKDLNPKKIMNTILWILITGARWIDVPTGSKWAARSTAHLWLGKWQEKGLLDQVLNLLLEKSDGLKLMGIDRIKIDGFFFTRTGRWRGSSSRIQGKRGYKSLVSRPNGQTISHNLNSSK
jgi:transposase